MTGDIAENRQYERIYFSKNEGPRAVFETGEDKTWTLAASVMDMSVGGLGLGAEKNPEFKLHVGDKMLLKEIDCLTGLEDFPEVHVRVRWIRDFDILSHVLVGCEFTDVPEEFESRIMQYMVSKMTP